MRLTNFAFIFTSIFLVIILVVSGKEKMLNKAVVMQKKYNQIVDHAVEDAAFNMLEFDSGEEKAVNKEKIMERFLFSLSAEMQDQTLEVPYKEVFLHIPAAVVIVEDGFYINYALLEDSKVERIFTKKIMYYYETDKNEYLFYLSNYLKIKNKESGDILEGDYHDIRNICSEEFLKDDELYELTRRNCIISTLTEKINYYINEHNKIAKHFGIEYKFALPFIDKEEWYRTIDDMGFLAFIQGVPYGSSKMGYYNKYALGAARVRKTNYYYVQKDKNTGRKYYHLENCKVLSDCSIIYDSKKECVLEGSYACPMCKP